jgi:hypothetical protein
MKDSGKGFENMERGPLHEGWSSYVNLTGVLVITVTEFVGKRVYILQYTKTLVTKCNVHL